MNNLNNKIIEAIQEGIQNALEFSLDDFNDQDEDLYIKKKKKSIDELEQENTENLFKKYHPIKIGDILYSNFKRDENGALLNLGDNKNGEPIGICCIEPYFLPDKEVRFFAISKTYPKVAWSFEHSSFIKGMDIENETKIINNNGKIIRTGSGFFGIEHRAELGSSEYFTKISSPYIKDEFNKQWLTENQCLADLQGWKETMNLQKYPECTIAQVSYDFYTKGTDRGDWYIPTLAELGILIYKYDNLSEYLVKFNIHDYNIWTITQNSWHSAEAVTIQGRSYTATVKKAQRFILPFFHAPISLKFFK